MAVKQHITELTHNQPNYDIFKIIEIIEMFQTNPEAIPTSVTSVKAICEQIVLHLAHTPAVREANDIKLMRTEIGKICIFFRDLENRTPDHYNDIVSTCLNKLYKLITSEEEISNYASAVLVLVDKARIRPGVQWILQEANNHAVIKKIFKTLANWLETNDYAPDLAIWIMEILSGLRDQQKNDLLVELSLDIIEPYCKKLAMPFFRPKLGPIILCILWSIRHTPMVFNLIVPKAPNLLRDVSKGDDKHLLTSFVDVLSALMLHFPTHEQHYKDLAKCLESYPRSENYSQALDVPFWNDTCRNVAVLPINARVGLVNLGNTCYMNSVLQALVMTKQFSKQILLSKIDEPLFLQLQKLLALLLHSDRPEQTPRALLVAARPPDFVPGYQQDSSEFLGYLLEKLHEQEKKLMTNRQANEKTWYVPGGKLVLQEPKDHTPGANGTNSQMLEGTDDGRQEPLSKTHLNESLLSPTLIQRTFDGKLFVTYQCAECGSQSSNLDSFRSFELSFPEPNSLQSNYSVQKLLEFYCSSEKLLGDNQYYCDKCKRLCDGERSIRVTKSPEILILTLKHFRYDQQRHTRAKLMNKVLHDEVISLPVASDTEPPVEERYSLYAAVIHAGTSMDSGHYYTYAQDKPDCWYKFNDNYVTKCSVDELHALSSPNTPYILFYQKLSPSAVDVIGSDAFDMEDDVIEPSFTGLISDVKLPELEELPQHLREIVRGDNQSYSEEIRKESRKMIQQRGVGTNHFTLPKNHDSDNDDPPPSSCGNNAIGFSNRSVY